ncbi:MAG: hypothetical protein DRI46_09305 [Chloroflexi bacterium]|nr:MAG: hypothetical protein DRI46_09305 [Chloroflexota bacterium]
MWTPVMRELATMKLQVRALERELARYEGKIRPQKPSPRLNGSIPDEILKRMIRLCHPDKHDSSEMATKVTQWLLEQK